MASALNFKKIYTGLKLVAKATMTSVGLGELEVSSVLNKLLFHDGTTQSSIVTENHTATLINKTIDTGSNTITGIRNANIPTDALIDVTKLQPFGDKQIIIPNGFGGNTLGFASWVNSQIANAAAIEFSKMENIGSANILVGNAAGVPTAVTMSGKTVITNAGVVGINPANLLVDSDIDPGADILRTKLLFGTPYVILANDINGLMNETTVTVANLNAASADGTLTSVVVTDNATTTIQNFTISTNDVVHIRYSIKRGATYESGTFTAITDGTSASYAVGGVSNIGDTGVTLSVTVSGSFLILRGVATSTGANATIKYKTSTWKS